MLAAEREPYPQVQKMIEVVELAISAFNRRVINDDFADACINLANLDKYVRTGNMPKYIPFIAGRDELDDLKMLAKIFLKEFQMPKEYARLNPTFGVGSEIVGGGDADMIVDGCLIDIKTTKKWALPIDYIHQLVGYVVLSDLNTGEVEPGGHCAINKVGIYFSRHGHLVSWDINNIVDIKGREAIANAFVDLSEQTGAESDDPSSWFGASPENDFNGME